MSTAYVCKYSRVLFPVCGVSFMTELTNLTQSPVKQNRLKDNTNSLP